MLGRAWGERKYEFEYGIAKRAGRLLAASYIEKNGLRFRLKYLSLLIVDLNRL